MSTSRSRSLITASVVGMFALAACGGGEEETTPDEALAEVAATCDEATATFAAAPALVDDAAEEEFRAAHRTAGTAVLSATREALEHVDDPALVRMERTLDGGFPTLQGGWTATTTAAQTLGTLDRLDRHATAAGLPGCAAAAWRTADWQAVYARHAGERPSAESFVAEVEALCASTLTFSTLGESGAVGAAAAASTAKSGLSDFVRTLRGTVPPEAAQPGFFALVGAVSELQRAIPDVPSAVTDPAAVDARIALAAADSQDAFDALGISC